MKNAKWLLKEELNGSCASLLENHFLKISALGGHALASSVHRIDAALTVVFKVKGDDLLGIQCPTCAEKLVQILRVRMYRDIL